jgi:murein tripeptide amidase MpaA
MKLSVKIFALFCVSLGVSCLLGCAATKKSAAVATVLKGTSYDPPGSTLTTDKPILLQTKRTVVLEKLGIAVSNEFDGGRMSDVAAINDSTLSVLILPENYPINASAWYAFKLWKYQASGAVQMPKNITLKLTYAEGTRHRYTPKLSRDGRVWSPVASSQFEVVSATEAVVRLTLDDAPRDTIWCAGQRLFTSQDFERWTDSLARKPFVRKSVVGRSVMGRPIPKLELTEARAGGEAAYAVLISRQHPPEVTGTLAFTRFVEELAGDTELARNFRKRCKVVIVPCVNPDGVDMGHWRHNAHGVDLNRDWAEFRQPEPRQVSAEFLKLRQEAERRGKKVLFGIDFHSTGEDIFYVIPADTAAQEISTPEAEDYKRSYKRIHAWLQKIQTAQPTYRVYPDESPDNLTTPSSNRWMNRELRAATTTYEVGDNTDPAVVRSVAAAAAQAMMELMLEEAK